MSSQDVKKHFFMHISLLDPFLSKFEKIENFRFFQNFDLWVKKSLAKKLPFWVQKCIKSIKIIFLTHKLFPNKNAAVNWTSNPKFQKDL